ncbi:thioredoxin [Janthinobacterium sp. BJB412]|nr:thioredoxin [Janthinobacterium sp. BJB412]
MTAAPTSYAPVPFDAAMAALDTRAAEVLPPPTEQPYALDLGGHDGADDAPATPAREIDAEAVQAPDIVPDAPPRAPMTVADLAPAPAPAPTAFEQALELDLDIEAAASAEPAEATHTAADSVDAPAAAPAETAPPTKAAVWRKAAPPPAEAEPAPSAVAEAEAEAEAGAQQSSQAESAPERAPLPERESAPWPEPEPWSMAAPATTLAPQTEQQTEPEAAPSARQEPVLGEPPTEPADDAVAHQPPATPAATGDEPADAGDEEPGFVKRDRLNRRVGKVARIVMALGSVLLLATLAAQAVATFRNPLAAYVPALKPALLAICARAGCTVELPSQIDELSIEPGELQAVSETTFSFATQLRNQGRVGQTWPHIELTLNDANDKPVLRRVFTPREYLASQAEVDKGFSPRSEQSVKLYFELVQIKASGYHIAVFYP